MKRLNQILIKTKRQIFSEIVGNNPSIFEGEGFDFVELREYEYGDDVRKIDWNVTAKKQTPYIRVFREERELNIVVVALMSGSIVFGSKRLKQDLMAEIVALLGFSAVKNGDRFSFFSYTKSLKQVVASSKNINSVNSATKAVLEKNLIGSQIDQKALSKELFESIKRKSIIFVVGDFFGEFDFKLLSKKHEIIALIVRDKLEEELPLLGSVMLSDPATLKSMRFDLQQDIKDEYKKRVFDMDHQNYTQFRRDRVAFTKIYTHENPFVELRKIFLKR